MSAPINQTAKAASATSASGLPADWMSKLASGNASSDLSVDRIDFSKMLERHASGNNTGSSVSTATGASQTGGLSAEARNAMARAQANAQVARQHASASPQAVKAPHSEQPKTPQASGSSQQTARADSRPASKSPSASKTDQSERAEEKQDVEDPAEDMSKLAAVTGQEGAVVRELQTPDSVSAADPGAMLAWLSSLTQGEMSQAALGAEGGLGTEAGGAMAGQGADQGAAVFGKGADWMLQSMMAGAMQAGGVDISGMQAVEGGQTIGVDQLTGDFSSALTAEMLRGQSLAGTGQAAAAQSSETIATPVNSPDFSQALADKVGMLVKATGDDGTMTAELHLNPAEMGPISVKISLDGQSAQVDFAAAALETRRAIEASLPMLSAALDDVGLTLGGAGVSDQASQQSFAQSDEQGASSGGWGGRSADSDRLAGADDGTAIRTHVPSRGGLGGGLDLYA